MEKKISVCEICTKVAEDEKQKREENWIEVNGGSLHGISVWLKLPRGAIDSYMHRVGWESRVYDFCSIKCLVKALEQEESI